MNEELYLKVNNLKALIENHPSVIRLKELEKKMNENEEVMALAYRKDIASSIYSDTLNHFSEDSEQAKEKMKQLHEAKLALDNHPLVKEYLSCYKEVRELYSELNNILFANFNSNLCPKE